MKNTINTFGGYDVYITEPRPRMQVSAKFASLQTPELVAKTNAWMASFFGYTERIPDGVVECDDQRRTLKMNPATFNQLKAKMETYPC